MIDNDILSFLNLFDDDYIISLSNKGYLKRAKKDLEKIRNEIKIVNESPLELQIQDNKVIFNSPIIEDIICTCSDSKFCRHRIISIFYIQEKYQSNNSLDDNNDSKDVNLEDKYRELLDFDLKTLEKRFTKAKLLKGIKYFLGSSITKNITKNSLDFIFKNDFNDQKIKFSFKVILPLENNNCDNVSCKGRYNCEHNVASMIYYLIENNKIEKDRIIELIKKDLKPIDNKLLREVEITILEIINIGLTRITIAIAQKIKKLAFRIHYEVPVFEKLMNGLERDLNLFMDKNPKFDLDSFRNKIIRFFRILRLYQVNKSDYNMIYLLTRHKSEYVDVKELILYGVGKEYLEIGENAILKTYFLSKENKVFTKSLYLSLKSGDNYSNPRNKLHFMPLWDGSTVDAFSNKKVIIKRTKVNDDLVISSIVSSIDIKEEHNFKDLFFYDDFNILKNEYIKFRKRNTLLNVTYSSFYSLIKPNYYDNAVFDYENQVLIIDIYDENENRISLKFKYGDVPLRYRSNRKKVFDRIIKEFSDFSKEKPLLIFGKPYIDNKSFFINVISFFYTNNKIINPNLDWEK